MINCQNVTSNARDYCCDHTNACCDTGVGRFRLGSAGTSVAIIRSSASTATRDLASSATSSLRLITVSTSGTSRATGLSTSAVTGRASTPASSSSNFDTSSGLSTGAKAGIGVGAALGGIVVLSIIYLLWRKRKLKKITHAYPHELSAAGRNQPRELSVGGHVKPPELSGEGRNELPGERPQEMSAAPNPAWELPEGNRSPI